MDFAWSDEQLEFKTAAMHFAQQALNENVIERDQREEFSREMWRECADFGILGMPFPAAYGGAEANILTTMLSMEGLGYGCRDKGLIFALNAQMWSVQHPINEFGTTEQKAKYLPRLIGGVGDRPRVGQW